MSADPHAGASARVPSTSPSPSRPTAQRHRRFHVLDGLQCTPSRRSVKFGNAAHARHFLAFDTAVSRDERLLLFMELFVFRSSLVDRAVLPDFRLAAYTPEDLLEVRVITDPRHPAYGQAGLFAKSIIPSNTVVTPYAGFIEVFATSCNSRTYTMGFGALGDDYALDAEFVGNYGRFANDPRGVGTLQPNLSAENRFSSRGESFTALVSRRQISAGEEILMSYGKAHRLSATPWTNVQGEPVTRPRLGGVIPFPSFHTRGGDEDALSPPAAPQPNEDPSRALSVAAAAGGEAHVAVTVGEKTTAPGPVRASASPARSSQGAEEPLAEPPATPRSLDVANDLLWECTQCGMWSLAEASTADAPRRCCACGIPKLSGARLLSLLSSPSIAEASLLAGRGVEKVSAPRQAPMAAATRKSTTPPLSPVPLSTSSSASTSSGAFTSEHAAWPMNVPFLPWQVWDAAVPLSVLAKHSRFETQTHMFLYAVETGLSREKRSRSRHDADARGGSTAVTRRQRGPARGEPHATNGPPSASPSNGHRLTASVGEEVQQPRNPTSSPGTPDKESATPGRDIASASSSPSSGHRSHSRRAALWERQGELVSAELTRLAPGPAASHVPSAHPVPATTDSSDSVDTATAVAARSRSATETTPEKARGSQPGDANGGVSGAVISTVIGSVAKPPLSHLLSATHEVDRLIVLRHGDAAAAGPAAAAAHSFSPQILRLRRQLQCMTPRLFTGKSFEPGEVVSHVGGLLRERDDSRCRVCDSCLEIPMRFFLPPRLRWRLRARRSGSGAAASVPVYRAEDAADEDEALQAFCERLDAFSLVVTNEFMHCPCLVVEDDTEASAGRDRRQADDEVDDALASCNVALVLTMDGLGCPFACAVAMRPIAAFEPLVARAQ